jgi:hypothetical protein
MKQSQSEMLRRTFSAPMADTAHTLVGIVNRDEEP